MANSAILRSTHRAGIRVYKGSRGKKDVCPVGEILRSAQNDKLDRHYWPLMALGQYRQAVRG
jgi:hypothetical protein